MEGAGEGRSGLGLGSVVALLLVSEDASNTCGIVKCFHSTEIHVKIK